MTFDVDLKASVRTIPDYPKAGILVRDITTLLGDARAFRHPLCLAAGELHHMRPDSGRLAAQHRHRAAVDKIVAGGHLGDHETSAEGCGHASKRGIGDTRHRRQNNPVRDLNIADFQRLKL